MSATSAQSAPLIVGLTGGIGSGKSTAAAMFADLGVPIIDTDVIARELVEPGKPALAEIVREFGGQVLDSDQRLDRTALRHCVFADPERRAALEAILHPKIRREVSRQVALLGAPYCIVVIPLLVETGQRDLVDRVLVVDCAPEIQIKRAMQRDAASMADINAIMAAQASRDQRLALADDVLLNETSASALRTEVNRLHRAYLALASAAP